MLRIQGSLLLLALGLLAPAFPQSQAGAQAYVTYEGGSGPGQGRKAVLVAGDEEYRPEEALPMLARILAFRHGFKVVVLFSQDKSTGFIDPDASDHIPGLAQLQDADLMVLSLRFRELPDADMRHIVDYMHSGKPIIGLRTSTHAFDYRKNPESPYARYSWMSGPPPGGGFGRLVLGTTWAGHHGIFDVRSTRARVRSSRDGHPILRGVRDFWVPSDVYKTDPLPADAEALVDGQVLSGMEPDDPPVDGLVTQPVAWTRSYRNEKGRTARVVTLTSAAGADFKSADLRRLFVNACYWAVGLEAAIAPASDVEYIGTFDPAPWGAGRYRKGMRPADLAMAAPVALFPPLQRGNPLPAPAGAPAPRTARGIRPDGKRVPASGSGWYFTKERIP